eukprot:3915122-Pyramimonas_sp.AAC.1
MRTSRMLWPKKENGACPGPLPPRRGGDLERPAIRASCGGGGSAAGPPLCSALKLGEAPEEGRPAAAAALL